MKQRVYLARTFRRNTHTQFLVQFLHSHARAAFQVPLPFSKPNIFALFLSFYIQDKQFRISRILYQCFIPLVSISFENYYFIFAFYGCLSIRVWLLVFFLLFYDGWIWFGWQRFISMSHVICSIEKWDSLDDIETTRKTIERTNERPNQR